MLNDEEIIKKGISFFSKMYDVRELSFQLRGNQYIQFNSEIEYFILVLK